MCFEIFARERLSYSKKERCKKELGDMLEWVTRRGRGRSPLSQHQGASGFGPLKRPPNKPTVLNVAVATEPRRSNRRGI